MKKGLVFILAILLSSGIYAQDTTGRIDSSEVNTIGAIVQTLYDVISGPAGVRDWDKFKMLFVPTARMNAINYDKQGYPKPRFGSVDQYVKNAGSFFADHDFYEEEIYKEVKYYDRIAHVFSTYYTAMRDRGKSELFEDRGVNCIQLIYSDNRWWIVNILWNVESEYDPLPERYLRSGKTEVTEAAEPTPASSDKNTYKVYRMEDVEEKPEYPGGEIALLLYLSKHIEVPASVEGLSGASRKVTVKFIVSSLGKLEKITALSSSSHPEAVAAVKEALENMPAWKPGKVAGKDVNVSYPSITVAL